MPLPPGQHARSDFPRFGLDQFASRIPEEAPLTLRVSGPDGELTLLNEAALRDVPRTDQTSDLHCATTWSAVDLQWAGWRFSDVWRTKIEPQLTQPIMWLTFRSADGFRCRILLDDALAADVLLADTLNGEPLPILHGGPLRLVAPAHYGYKNPKHITEMAVHEGPPVWKSPTPFAFMEHPRARVAHEERGTTFPGSLLRLLFRPLIHRTVRRFAEAWERAPVAPPSTGA